MFQLQFILMLDADELQPMPVRRVRLIVRILRPEDLGLGADGFPGQGDENVKGGSRAETALKARPSRPLR